MRICRFFGVFYGFYVTNVSTTGTLYTKADCLQIVDSGDSASLDLIRPSICFNGRYHKIVDWYDVSASKVTLYKLNVQQFLVPFMLSFYNTHIGCSQLNNRAHPYPSRTCSTTFLWKFTLLSEFASFQILCYVFGF